MSTLTQQRDGVSAPSLPPVVPETVATITPAEEYTVILPTARQTKKVISLDDDEPLIDTTVAIPLNSKKTKRVQKQALKKKQKHTLHSDTKSFLELPPELLSEVLRHLQPSDILCLLRLSRPTRDFILDNEAALAREIIRMRYWVLEKCFPLPVALESVDQPTRIALLNSKRQEMLNIQKRYYQHIKPIDPLKTCSCMSCVLAWNNVCLILDLAHHQTNLNNRQPILMISRGSSPEWNEQLIESNASIVERAMVSPLVYAAILQKHLSTTAGTLLRHFKLRPPVVRNAERTLTNPKSMAAKTTHPKRQYHITAADAEAQTDEFLERCGPPSYELPFHRDNYYNLQAYVPNRKWSKEEERWKYYDGTQHEKDLAWARSWIKPQPRPEESEAEFVASFKAALRT